MINEIHLLGKKIIYDKSPLLLKYSPSADWLDYWAPKSGNWECDGEWIIGREPENKGGILFSKENYDCDVMMRFTVKTELPATRDLNAVFCAEWDDEKDYLGRSYVCGLNGWYENKAGIEKCHCGDDDIEALTNAYYVEPGTEVQMTVGSVQGHSFMLVNDKLITELRDRRPLIGGHIGFSAYCTVLKIKNVEIRRIYWEDFPQKYDPEF